jgi:hypothetical protein
VVSYFLGFTVIHGGRFFLPSLYRPFYIPIKPSKPPPNVVIPGYYLSAGFAKVRTHLDATTDQVSVVAVAFLIEALYLISESLKSSKGVSYT